MTLTTAQAIVFSAVPARTPGTVFDVRDAASLPPTVSATGNVSRVLRDLAAAGLVRRVTTDRVRFVRA